MQIHWYSPFHNSFPLFNTCFKDWRTLGSYITWQYSNMVMTKEHQTWHNDIWVWTVRTCISKRMQREYDYWLICGYYLPDTGDFMKKVLLLPQRSGIDRSSLIVYIESTFYMKSAVCSTPPFSGSMTID